MADESALAPHSRCLASGSTASEVWAEVWDEEYLTIPDRFHQRRCLDCGALFIDPVPSDRLAEIYPRNYYSFVPRGRPSLALRVKEALDRRFFRDVLKRVPGHELSVLDVGGGAGWQLDIVRACDPRVRFTQVVDFDAGAADVARGKGHGYFCGTIEDFESARPFDVIVLLNLIEHVSDPLRVLKKLRGLLAPAGVIVVKTPNHDSLDARLFRHRNWGGFHAPRHWVIFTRESFDRICRRAGLSITQFRYTQGAPFWATSVLFVLARLGLVQVTRERPAVYHPLFPLLAAAGAGFDFIRAPFAKLSQMLIVLQRDDA